jgi:LPS sulfotransferase NodH
MEFKDMPFPLNESQIITFMEKASGPVLFLCDSQWFSYLNKVSSTYKFSVIVWEERNKEEFPGTISDFKVVVIALPEGEESVAKAISGRLLQINCNVLVLRLLRDIFLQISLQIGGNFVPQEMWKRPLSNGQACFIFAVPRSGSTFFGDILAKTNLLGFPREHLLKEHVPLFINTDFTFNEWIRALIRFSFTPNGYSSTKIISYLFLVIAEEYQKSPDLYNDLLLFFKDYPVIYLKRMNKVRQAVSLIKATNSSVWHIKNNEKIIGSRSEKTLSEGPEEIENMIVWLIEQEQSLEKLFRKAGIKPRVYFYEDFSDVTRKQSYFNEVIKFLGVEYRNSIPDANYSALSDEYNEEVVRKYFAHIQTQMRGDFNSPEPLKSFIMASMASEISVNHDRKIYKTDISKSKRKWFRKF